jgi:large subunit ribosomal protein L18
MRKVLRKNLNRKLRKARSRKNMLGTALVPRVSVFRSNRYVYAQLIDDAKGITLASSSSRELKEKKIKKTDAAKAIGSALGEKAKKLGITSAVFHRASYRYHGRVKAVADGLREAGIKI